MNKYEILLLGQKFLGIFLCTWSWVGLKPSQVVCLFSKRRAGARGESEVHVGEEGRGKEGSVEEKPAPQTHVDQHVLLGDTWSHTTYTPTVTRRDPPPRTQPVRVILSLHAPTPPHHNHLNSPPAHSIIPLTLPHGRVWLKLPRLISIHITLPPRLHHQVFVQYVVEVPFYKMTKEPPEIDELMINLN